MDTPLANGDSIQLHPRERRSAWLPAPPARFLLLEQDGRSFQETRREAHRHQIADCFRPSSIGNPRRMDIPAGFMPAFPRYRLLVLCALYHHTLGLINIHVNYPATCLVGATKQSSTLPRGALAKAKRAVFLATRPSLFVGFFHAAAPMLGEAARNVACVCMSTFFFFVGLGLPVPWFPLSCAGGDPLVAHSLSLFPFQIHYGTSLASPECNR